MKNNLVICIGRQFGSGGRHIGRLVGEKLGIKVYDKELINLASEASGISKELLKSYDEKPTNSLLYSLSLGTYSFENFKSDPMIATHAGGTKEENLINLYVINK